MRKLVAIGTGWLALAVLMTGCGGSSPAARRSSATTQTSTTTIHPASSTTSPGTSTTPPSQTEIQTYNPWTAAGTLSSGVEVKEHLAGTGCDGASVFDGENRYAWECQLPSGGAFYYPCFAPPGETNVTQVACASSPWSGVTVIDLVQPLAQSSWGTPTPKPSFPWAMVLANGQDCGLIYGTGSEVDGVEFNYGCTAGYTAYPSTSMNQFTAQYVPSSSGPVISVAVTTEWA